MERREVEFLFSEEPGERSVEDPLVAAVFAPAIMALVDGCPVNLLHGKIFPLDTGMEHVEDVVEDLEV